MSHKRKRKFTSKSKPEIQAVVHTQVSKDTEEPAKVVNQAAYSPPQMESNPRTSIVCLLITIIGFAVYFTGLTSPFQGDDNTQIVNNPVVHSFSHIRSFFEGGTFYSGSSIDQLTGNYRPLMTTTYSLLYTLFGPHTFPFHLLQLLLCIGSTVLLYLVFRYSLGSLLSLVLSLIFLVHPIDSQVVFAIPSMQDALCMFFGLSAIWLLLYLHSIKSLLFVAGCLFLALLSKESGVLFVAMALLYLFWFDRKRLLPFASIAALPVALWLSLRIDAVGAAEHLNVAPIDNLSLAGRLMTAPAIMQFYITKFVFPWKLASGYYWVYPGFSVRHVLLPLIVDLTIIGLFVYLGFMIYKRLPRAQFLTYLLFGAWAAAGLLAYSQIVPLDATAYEAWFYFPMVGVLGMIGVVLVAFQTRIRPSWFFVAAALVLVFFGLRTVSRGLDYRSEYALLTKDIAASKEDWPGYNRMASILNDRGDYGEARAYAQRSISTYPADTNYQNLGFALLNVGDYSGAVGAYQQGLHYGDDLNLYQSLGGLMLIYGNYDSDKQLLLVALQKYPQDATLWSRLAVLEARYDHSANAKADIATAARYGQVSQYIYSSIMNDRPFIVSLPKENLKIP